MAIKNKKGDKSLNMIFGLFLLLIITLVVLNLFFKFTEKSTKSLEASSTEYYSKAQIDTVKQQCQQLCEGINDINGMIEFCGKSFIVDWNGDKITKGQSVRLGRWEFCEEKIPCFVLVDNCGEKANDKAALIDGKKCREILTDANNNRLDYFEALAKGNYPDVCDLKGNTTDPNPGTYVAGVFTNSTPNWKLKWNYSMS